MAEEADDELPNQESDNEDDALASTEDEDGKEQQFLFATTR